MRIVVAGSRDMPGALTWIARGFQLSCWHPTVIISGGGGAVDEAAEEYAAKNDVLFELFVAEWNDKGPEAGKIRNTEMAEASQMLLAIWDGASGGTHDMIRKMRQRGKPVFVMKVEYTAYWEPSPPVLRP